MADTFFSCAAGLEEVQTLAAHLRDRCAALKLADDAVIDLELAMVEAANNIVLHGYAGHEGTLSMAVRCADNTITVELRDHGVPMPAEMLWGDRPFSLDAESGRGIAIMQSCVDDIVYRQEGGINVLTLAKRLRSAPAT